MLLKTEDLPAASGLFLHWTRDRTKGMFSRYWFHGKLTRETFSDTNNAVTCLSTNK